MSQPTNLHTSKPVVPPSSQELEDHYNIKSPRSDDYWDHQEIFAPEEIDRVETLALVQSALPPGQSGRCTLGSMPSIVI